MIDRDIIDDLEKSIGESVRSALRAIISSGIIESQQQRLLARLAAGATTEDEVELGRRIRAYRTDSQMLESLKELGRIYNQET